MEDRPVYSYIPKNLNTTGGLFGGSVDTRRLVEGIICVTAVILIYRILSVYILSENLLYICAFIAIGLFVACVIGGNGEPFSIFLLNFINYERRRIFVTLRPPMPDFEKKKRKKPEKEGGTFEDRLMAKIKGLTRKGGEEVED